MKVASMPAAARFFTISSCFCPAPFAIPFAMPSSNEFWMFEARNSEANICHKEQTQQKDGGGRKHNVEAGISATETNGSARPTKSETT